jgi:hypothetical protein
VRTGSENVEINFRVTRPLRNVRLIARGQVSQKIYFEKKFRRLIPSELEKVKIQHQLAEDLELTGDAG